MDEQLKLRRGWHLTTHGHTVGRTYSPTYQSWQAMLARCRYPHRDVDKKHSARGITVCDRWQSFASFLTDMGERLDGTTLDRWPNPNGNYEPGNCRWATPIDQARNRRNARLTFDTAVEIALARLHGVPCKTLAAQYGCSESLPREVVKGRTWRDASRLAHKLFSEGRSYV